MFRHASFLYLIYVPFLHPSVLPQVQQSYSPAPILVVWPAHNLLITLPASHQPFCFSLSTLSEFTCFRHIHTFFSLNMSEYILFLFMFYVAHLLARLSRAIQHNFSRLAGAQFTDCYICLPNTHSVWVCTNHPISPVYYYLSLRMFHAFHRSVPHRSSRVTMEHNP